VCVGRGSRDRDRVYAIRVSGVVIYWVLARARRGWPAEHPVNMAVTFSQLPYVVCTTETCSRVVVIIMPVIDDQVQIESLSPSNADSNDGDGRTLLIRMSMAGGYPSTPRSIP
jgi:hypothetical protein